MELNHAVIASRQSRYFGALLIVLLSCSSSDGPTGGNNAPPPLTPQTADCTAANSSCPELVIANHPPATLQDGRPSPARGFADPSFRRDPANNVIWVAYSWPYLQFGLVGSTLQSAVTVDSHLARSSDGGATWIYLRPLWAATQVSDETGTTGWLNSEVVSLASSATSVWHSVRLRYFVAPAGSPKINSFTLRIATASSPEFLLNAEEASLGGALTASHWRPDVNLATLSSELAGCTWNDPALLFRDGTLYLAAQCMVFVAGVEAPDREFVAVFATQPNGGVKTWSWRYLGRLGGQAEARELGGETLLQTDLALGQDGQLLAIFSPSRPGTPLAAHFGCRVVEVASLDPPRLTRDAAGRLRVRASVTASDLMPEGPGACGYEPSSTAGLVIVRRIQSPGQLVVSLHRTGIRP